MLGRLNRQSEVTNPRNLSSGLRVRGTATSGCRDPEKRDELAPASIT